MGGAIEGAGGTEVRGGLKFYRGSGAAARNYVEADRSRADDYYLAEGGGVADRWVFDAAGGQARRSVLDGDSYQLWVEGIDPATGEIKGRLRSDGNALRFCETVVNGPKSWSIAAALHPELSAALDGAQDRAVARIGRYVAAHAVTRVGPRGGQVQVGVGQVELAAVRHYTSRAGDPHRHIHLQINARMVGVDGKWRGVDSAALREQVQAINGIGHASVVCDPVFRQRLATLGYTLDLEGEIEQLAAVVPAMSKRSAQVTGLVEGFERAWQIEHPGQVPGPAIVRGWDARAWNQGRPEKKDLPLVGDQWQAAWRAELSELGVDLGAVGPAAVFEPVPAATVDRDQVAAAAVAAVSARRSAWNTADIRGAVELELARAGVIAGEQALTELAEQITELAASSCRSILDGPASVAAPVQSRQWTSAHVVQVEADLTGRMAIRSAMGGTGRDLTGVSVDGLDEGQRAAVAVVCGTHALAVIQGAAGAGKTTMLAAAKQIIQAGGGRLVLITPTLKAARIAQSETGAATSSAAKLAHEHGYRWDAAGVWTRLTVGDLDPRTGAVYQGPGGAARLAPGSVIVVDEAGMLDQDTARAVFTIADEADARIVLVGDRAQHAAVGRGGVLDLATRWTGPDAQIEMDQVHRFRRETVNEVGDRQFAPDVDYAALSLAMRQGTDPAAVFDELRRRGQIIVAGTPEKAHEYIADQAAATLLAGRSHSVVAATNEQAQLFNSAIRDRLVTAGRVHDTVTVTGMDGHRIGVGDTITTRVNSTAHRVANRDTWTVTHVDPAGVLTVTGPVDRHTRTLPPAYVQTAVQLGYATTGHGAQGATTDAASMLHTEHTDAAGQYVAMTRGRLSNTAVIIAGNQEQARNQWVAAAGRDRADRGLDAARAAAQVQAQQYQTATTQTPTSAPVQAPDPQTSPQPGHPAERRVPAAPEPAPTQRSGSAAGPPRTALRELLDQIRPTDIAATPLPSAQPLATRRRELVQQYRQALADRISTLTSRTEQYTAQLLEQEQARTAQVVADRAKAAELKPLIQTMAVQVEQLRAKSGMDAPPAGAPHIIGSPSVAEHVIDRATEDAQQIRGQYTAELNRQLAADRDKVLETHRAAQQAARSAEQASVFRRAAARRAAEQAHQRAAQVRAAATARWEGIADPDPQRRAEGIKNLVDQQPAVVAADQAVDQATAKLTYITAAQNLYELRQQLQRLEPDPVRDREARTAADLAALSFPPDPAIAQHARDQQLLADARARSAALQHMSPAQQVAAATQWKTDVAAHTIARAAQQIQAGIRQAQQQAAQQDRDRNYHYEQQHHYDHGPSLGM